MSSMSDWVRGEPSPPGTTLALCALLALSLALPASAAPRPIRLEGLEYPKARAIILGLGWRPIRGACEGPSAETCARYPEIQACSGVEEAPCAMNFGRKSRCLSITTKGGEPQPGPTDAHVTFVEFRPGPCVRG